MQIYSYKDHKPSLGKDCFLADGARIIGRAVLQDQVNVWFNTVIRADVNEIFIGENTNIQDLSMLHVTEENGLTIGKNVTIGHSVTLHACKIGDGCLIGMGATILDGSKIGENSLVAAGSVVPPNKSFPPHSFIIGAPAKAVRTLEEQEKFLVSNHYKSYVGYAKEFLDPKLHQALS